MATTAEDCTSLIGCAVDNWVESQIGDAIKNLEQAVVEALGRMLGSLGTIWVRFGVPELTGGGAASAGAPPAAGRAGLETIAGYVLWISLALAVMSLFALAGTVAFRHRRGEGIVSVGRMGLVLVAVVLMSSASAIVAAVLPDSSAGAGGTVAFLQSSLWYYVGAGAVFSIIVGAARMVWEQRARPGRDLLGSLIQLVVVSGAGVFIVGLLITAAESYSMWVLDRSLACDVASGACFGENMTRLIVLTNPVPAATTGVPMPSFLVIVLGILAIFASIVQVLMMIARGAMLVILTGILPLSASATNTEAGRTWFKKNVGWLVAFILYKPAAAVVYAAAFQLAGTDLTDPSGPIAVLSGLVLMVLALLALPALMRFVTPMVSSMTSGGSGGGMALAAAAVPTGAMAVAPMIRGGGGSTAGPAGRAGGAGATGPSGSAQAAPAAQTAGRGATGAMAAGAAKGGAVGGPAGAAAAGSVAAGQAGASAVRSVADKSTGEGEPRGSGR